MTRAHKGRDPAPIDSLELAEAAVFADLTVGLCVLGWILPAGGVITAAAVAPMAALGARHRLATVVAGGVCASAIAMLVGGIGLAANAVGCTVLGGVIGVAERHRWSRLRVLIVGAIAVWPILAGLALLVLAVLSALRRLLLVQITNGWKGTRTVLAHLPLGRLLGWGDDAVRWSVDHWWAAVALGLLGTLELALFLAHVLARPTLARLPPVARIRPEQEAEDGPPAPIPIAVRDVTYRYPGADQDALASVSVDIDEATFTAIEGPNGSGKSTLARILAGRAPTCGAVHRPGAVGLGRVGGTALVFQRPETQVLGMRVRDDVLWGRPVDGGVDVDRELVRVGLGGFGERDTSTLSGGELQRLAVAAALARRPGLLISDETTAMIDAEGRQQMLGLLHHLRDAGLTIVHVSHRPEEASAADHVVYLRHGSRVTEAPSIGPAASAESIGRSATGGAQLSAPLIRLRGVGHVYDARSPWAHRALEGVAVDIRSGEGVLIHGANGSGKSTLAWILAGLLVPSEGHATLDGVPVSRQLPRLGLSFQHARLQLERNTVLDDVRAASGVTTEQAAAALTDMGLDPSIYAERGIDELSGGQQRRVALAGLLAADPSVLVLDEPFAGLDADGRQDLVDILVGLRDRGTTVILVSHDLEGTERVVDHTIELHGGRVLADTHPPEQPTDVQLSAAGSSRRAHLGLFRVLPAGGPLHRTWAGTKLIALVALGVAVSVSPQWPMLIAGVATVAAGLVIAGVPRSAAPRVPRWVWISLAIALAANLAAGGAPTVQLGGMRIGLGGADHWLQATVLGLTIIVGAALVSWTTPLAEVTPALDRILRPLRLLRLPVQRWVATTALGLRSLPLLLDELRTLAAARRMRAAHSPPPHPRWRHRLREPMDLLAAAAVTAARRAREFADAIDARGGAVSPPQSRPQLGYADALVAGTVVVAIAIGALAGR